MSDSFLNNSFRLPAEWECESDILLAWPHESSDWVDMLPEVQKCYIELIDAFIKAGHRVILIIPGSLPHPLAHYSIQELLPVNYLTNDTWTRDYGPISFRNATGQFQVADFKFNGWGLKFSSDRDNLVNNHLIESGLIAASSVRHLDFVLEGGGIDSDGRGTILTTSRCQMSLNRNGGRFNPELESQLRRFLYADRILSLQHGYLAGDDTDSHVDTLVRFAPGNSIVFVSCSNPADEHYQELSLMAEEIRALRTIDGLPYNLVELPLPDPIFDENGLRLPATYANFLATDKAVFMPSYGQPDNDLLARQMLKIVFNTPVYSIDCRPLIRQHGSLHCATMQIPKQILSI